MRWAKIIAVILIILVGGYFAFEPILNNINLGLDLQGGVHVVLLAEKPEGGKITKQDMQQLKAVMTERVDELGVAEPVIQIEGERRLIIELPGVKDPEKAVDIIGRTAYLEFKTYDGRTILTGSDLSDAKGVINPTTNEPIIDLQLNERGTKVFAKTTSELVKKYREGDPRRVISIYLDGKMLTSPFVKDVISNGRAQISGGFKDYDEAANLAALLRAGALPVNVKVVEKRTVGPILGADSLVKSKRAVFYGFLLVMLYMLFFYRVPGLVAGFSLLVYGLLILGVLAAINATLTLPGIAGFLLSIGMAVDANVVIYERIKEEIRSGKTLRASVEAGFKRSLLTVMDANITNLLAAAVLFKFGTGPVRGFAVTLSIGVLASLFTAIVLTRYILRELTVKDLINNPKLFGFGL